jgi:hypothetical protein
MSMEGRTGKFLQNNPRNSTTIVGRKVGAIVAISLLLISAGPLTFSGSTEPGVQAYGASDIAKPLVSIEKPASKSALTPGTVMVSGKASDNKGGSGVQTVAISLDGGPYKAAKPEAPGDWSTWSVSFSVWKAGTHEFKAKTTDRAGNKDWDAVAFSIKAPSTGGSPDTADPNIAITYPIDGKTVAATRSITIKGTASDSGGSGINVVKVRVDSSSYKTATPKTPKDWSSWSVTFPVTAGQHRLVARAADNAGNQEWDTLDITVNDSTSTPTPSPQPAGRFPVPTGFAKVGDFNTNFKFWGRYTTNYASGGSGPSQRWENTEMNKLNMIAGYEFKIGPEHGTRGNDEVSLKFPRCETPGGERGVYDPNILWYTDGRDSLGRAGKEWPHPTTWLGSFNTDNPRPKIGNIKDGQWHGFLAAVYNDPLNNDAVTMKLWYNPTASGLIQDYIYLGSSVDTAEKRISPGPILAYDCDPTSGGTHPMQIRIDEIPQGSLEVRNMFAAEVIPPS